LIGLRHEHTKIPTLGAHPANYPDPRFAAFVPGWISATG
jgi:hypothetical protein